MAFFEAQGVSRLPWFAGFDLSLQAGEISVLRGASGSGKTLLLRGLADLDPIDAGRVLLEGRVCAEVSPQEWRRLVRYVHQRAPRLGPTVQESVVRAELIACGGAAGSIGVPPGLSGEQQTTDLSGGEAQRLALHLALESGAKLLLLDEPTSALDPEAAAQAEARVRAFAASGGAVLWVSHDAQLAQRLEAGEVAFP